MSEVLNVIERRASVRSYKPEQVRDEDLAAILRAGQQAPIAGGSVHFSVVQNRELLEEISEAGRQEMLNGKNEFHRQRASLEGYTPLYHAPTLVVLSGPKGAPFNQVNAALAVENMMLAATDLGYGSCYLAGITPVFAGEDDTYRRKVGMPEGNVFACGLILGFTDDPKKFCPDIKPDRSGNINYVK